ncbi:MAG: DNA translocase FtsK 4TM domain-containing protein [Oxalobacter sp.]|nr:DNA translocase FtsK 4TM domain-containing protein [Oxalobacter sp.]
MTDQTKETDTKEDSAGFSLALLKNEIIWLVLVAVTLYFFLIFITFNRNDPGWSHASQVDSIANMGGRTGAWIADILLFIFGLSAWWIALPLLKGIWTGCKRIAAVLRNRELPEPSLFRQIAAIIGFCLLIVSSSGIEYLRMYRTDAQLPNIPGGIVGDIIGQISQQYLGFTCGTALLGLIAFIGFSLCLQKSWIAIVEGIGAVVEWPFTLFRRQPPQPTVPVQDSAVPENAAANSMEPDATTLPVPAGTGTGTIIADEPAQTAIVDTVVEAPATTSGASTPETEAPVIAETLTEKAEDNTIGFTGIREPVLEKFEEPVLERTVESPEPVSRFEPSPLYPETEIADVVRGNQEEQTIPQAAPTANPAPKAAPVLGPALNAVQEPVIAPETILPDYGPVVPSLPPLSLLDPPEVQQESASPEALDYTSRLIERKLADFGVKVRVVSAFPGPVVTRYEIEPAVGVKGSSIVNLSRDLARSLSLVSIRVVENVPGKTYMALELPNTRRQIVHLSEILDSDEYNNASSNLTVALGKDITGKPVVADLARMPHLLIAGTTGSGKSVGINATILSLLYKATPDQVRLILIDPKMLELSIYQDIPHLLAPVVIDMKKADHALNWAVSEMEKRYLLMSKMGVRNLAGYNKRIEDAEAKEQKIPNPFSLTPEDPEPLKKLPQIVIIVDEFSDLMMTVGKKVEQSIARIAQKARAAGIHLILATQRPSVDVITGLIKANIPTRIAFQVSSKVDSRTILDQTGAETLLGLGDMLYLPPGTGLPKRVHGAFVSDDEVTKVVSFLKQQGEPDYIDGILESADEDSGAEGEGYASDDGESDEKYDEAVAIVLKNKKASISMVQRHLRIGYNRAARLLEQMERSGLVSPMKSNGTRDVIVPTSSDDAP